jgi:hypothetical protein
LTNPAAPGPPRTDGGAAWSVVIGAIGIVTVLLSPVLGPIALAQGLAAKKRIAASGGSIGGAGLAQAGYVLGIIGTVLGSLIILGFGICVAMLMGLRTG